MVDRRHPRPPDLTPAPSKQPGGRGAPGGSSPGLIGVRGSALVRLRRVHRIADRSVELELRRRRAEWLAGRPAPTTPRPVCSHLVRPTRSVADATVERLNRQPALHAPAHQRVKAPAESVDLDDVTRPNSLESHPRQRTRRPGGLPRSPPAREPRRRDGAGRRHVAPPSWVHIMQGRDAGATNEAVAFWLVSGVGAQPSSYPCPGSNPP